ncbi:thiamine pyrophosphate-dependent dehydrogenase E1 component subunit alpha [Planktomarina temperata]|nr:thiamine pyrophosphate-dependent dehydrogenase E1 component subunit alpha [Planktomarina temperata]
MNSNTNYLATKFYKEILRIRNCELKISELYKEQEMRCPIHLCIGQEAVPVGISANLSSNDKVFSNHRSHGHYLSKGGDMNAMIAEFYGRATGCAAGKGGSQHLIDLECNFMGSAPILASTISVAVGMAWAAQLNGSNEIIVCYFGDGATEEGNFYESLNFAQLKSLNVLFVCENNLYSVHTKTRDRRPEGMSISNQVSTFGIGTNTCDGNDVIEIDVLSKKIVNKMREEPAPHFIEAKTYRWLEHCGPNDDSNLGYRTEEEINFWKTKDPLLKLRPLLDHEAQVKIDCEIDQEISAAFKFAKNSKYPQKSELFTDVFPQNVVYS